MNQLNKDGINLDMINIILDQCMEQLDEDDKSKIDKHLNKFIDYTNNSKFYITNNGNMVLPSLSLIEILSLINDIELYDKFIKGTLDGSQISNQLLALARSTLNSNTVHFELETTWYHYTVNMNEEPAFKLINDIIEPFMKYMISLMNDIHNPNKVIKFDTTLNDLIAKIFTSYEQSMTEYMGSDQLCEGIAEYKGIMHFLNMLYNLPKSKCGVCSMSYEQLKQLDSGLINLIKPETVADQLINEKISEYNIFDSDKHDGYFIHFDSEKISEYNIFDSDKHDGYFIHFDSDNSKINNDNISSFKIDVNYKANLIRIKSLVNEVESLTKLSSESNNLNENILHTINDRLNELNSLSNHLSRSHYKPQKYVDYKNEAIMLIDKLLDSDSINNQTNEELMLKLFQLNMILNIKS